MCPKIGGVYPPKCMVKIIYFMENPMNKWMIWGYSTIIFGSTPISWYFPDVFRALQPSHHAQKASRTRSISPLLSPPGGQLEANRFPQLGKFNWGNQIIQLRLHRPNKISPIFWHRNGGKAHGISRVGRLIFFFAQLQSRNRLSFLHFSHMATRSPGYI